MATTTHPGTTHADSPHSTQKRKLVRLRPTQHLGDRLPAMHLVRSSWAARGLSRALLALLVILLVAAIFLPWQQTSGGSGQVIARLPQMRLQAVESPTKGIIDWIKDDLREGTIVEAGEIIMKLKPFAEDAQRLNAEVAKAQEETLKSYRVIYDNMVQQVKSVEEQAKQEIAGAEADVAAYKNAWEKAMREVDEQLPKYNKAKNERERYQGLQRDLISEFEYYALEQQELSELGKLEGTMASAKKAYSDLESKERALEGKRRSVEQKVMQAQSYVDKALTEVNTAQKELNDVLTKQGEFERLDVPSPSRGRIQALRGQAGTHSVKEGDKLFEVVPETDDLAVELTVRGIDTPLIHVGDPVRLQFEGWPAVQFVGWPSVAVGTFPGEVIAINPTDSGKGVFKIMVGPMRHDANSKIGETVATSPFKTQNEWPDSRYLRQGVRANGWVILKTVPLWYEIWRQINGFPITISDSEPGESKSKDPKPPKVK